MEGIFAGFVKTYGTVGSLVFIGIIIWFFLREIKKDLALMQASVSSMRDELLREIQELRDLSNARDDAIMEELKSMEEEIRFIHKEYLRKEDHYRDLGGWRAEFRDMQERIDAIYKLVLSTKER